MRALSRLIPFVLLFVVGACAGRFNVREFSTSATLYEAGLAQYKAEKWVGAIQAFEKLTFDLPQRDTLLALSHWYLGQARRQNDERVLAAQSFIRLGEQFPEDTLADDAVFQSAISYREMWRRPSLDPQYGILAQAQFQMLLSIFPDSPHADSAMKEIRRLDEWFASKDYETGVHYFRRRAYDSAIIYFQDVVTNFPNTDKARESMLQLVRIYRLPVMNYKADAEEVCGALRAGFPRDPEVLELCKLPAAEAVPSAGEQ